MKQQKTAEKTWVIFDKLIFHSKYLRIMKT